MNAAGTGVTAWPDLARDMISSNFQVSVAGLKEGEAEVEVALKKLERGSEEVAAFKNKVTKCQTH